MTGPGDEDLDAALAKWRADNLEDDNDPDGASAETHDKLQKRVADEEKRRRNQ